MDASDYVHRNVRAWEERRDEQRAFASERWAMDDITWGILDVPESDAQLLGESVEGNRVLELGCGTAYVSAWLARRGASTVAVDPSAGQLAIARSCQVEYDLRFPLVRACGEDVPFADASFDLVVSEYGAAIWADPYQWVPEAARVLRPGGELVFLGNSTLLMLCVPDEEGSPAADQLLRAQRGMHRFEWPDTDTVEFHLSHGDWIRLFRSYGLAVQDLVELYPVTAAPPGDTFVTAEWAAQWPCEEVWRVRKE